MTLFSNTRILSFKIDFPSLWIFNNPKQSRIIVFIISKYPPTFITFRMILDQCATNVCLLLPYFQCKKGKLLSDTYCIFINMYVFLLNLKQHNYSVMIEVTHFTSLTMLRRATKGITLELCSFRLNQSLPISSLENRYIIYWIHTIGNTVFQVPAWALIWKKQSIYQENWCQKYVLKIYFWDQKPGPQISHAKSLIFSARDY